MSPPVKRCHCPARPPRRIHTHISSAGLVTKLKNLRVKRQHQRLCFWSRENCQDVKLVVLLWAICQMFIIQRGWSLEKVRYDILKLIKELYPGPADFPGFMVGNYLSIIPDPTLFYKRWTRGVLSVLLIYPKSYSFSSSYICQQGSILHSTFYLVYKKPDWEPWKLM